MGRASQKVRFSILNERAVRFDYSIMVSEPKQKILQTLRASLILGFNIFCERATFHDFTLEVSEPG